MLFGVERDIETMHVFLVLRLLLRQLHNLDLLISALLLELVNLPPQPFDLLFQGTDTLLQSTEGDISFGLRFDQLLHLLSCIIIRPVDLLKCPGLFVDDTRVFALHVRHLLTKLLSSDFALNNALRIVGYLGIPLTNVLFETGDVVIAEFALGVKVGDTLLVLLQSMGKVIVLFTFLQELLLKLEVNQHLNELNFEINLPRASLSRLPP